MLKLSECMYKDMQNRNKIFFIFNPFNKTFNILFIVTNAYSMFDPYDDPLRLPELYVEPIHHNNMDHT